MKLSVKNGAIFGQPCMLWPIVFISYLLPGSKQSSNMASDLLESYIQQFSNNTAEIISTTTKIPSLYGSKTITAVNGHSGKGIYL